MKKIYIVLILVLFLDVSWGQVRQSFVFGNPQTMTTTYDGITYTSVYIPDFCFKSSTIGMPSLPVKILRVLVPYNATNISISINDSMEHPLHIAHDIIPTQESLVISSEKNGSFTGIDYNVYQGIFPSTCVEVVDQNIYRGNKIITLVIYPCRYNISTKTVYYKDSLSFTVDYDLDETIQRNSFIMKDSMSDFRYLSTIINNPEDIPNFSSWGNNTLQDHPRIGRTSLVSQDCDYVIVTTEQLAPSFSEFIRWKKRKGVKIELVKIDDILSAYSGDVLHGIDHGIFDNAGKLRQFLYDAYNGGTGIQYALLAGSVDKIPIRYGHPSRTQNNDIERIIPSDLYFSDFDGDWFPNSQGLESDIDNAPEISVGRLTFQSATEVVNWTRKIIVYETNPGAGNTSYLRKGLFVQADELQNRSYAQRVIAAASWCPFSTIIEEEGGGNTSNTPQYPKGSDVIDEFNNHYGFCAVFAHGGTTNFAVATKRDNENEDFSKYKVSSFDYGYDGCCAIQETGNSFENMNNSDYPTVLYSISCHTMPFDNYDILNHIGERNMGEVFTGISLGGGVAYLGNTRNGYMGPTITTSQAFASYVPQLHNIGLVENAAQGLLSSSYDRYTVFTHNLMGCPETEMWTTIPSQFTNVVISENNGIVTVSSGTDGATICLMSALDNGESYYCVRKNVSDVVFTDVTMPYVITITKHNYIPWMTNLDDVYIQNSTIVRNKTYYGNNIYAGEHVADDVQQGPVTVRLMGTLTLDAVNDVVLEKGFSVQLTGALLVK